MFVYISYLPYTIYALCAIYKCLIHVTSCTLVLFATVCCYVPLCNLCYVLFDNTSLTVDIQINELKLN